MEKYNIDKATNTYRLLEKLCPPHDQNYVVYAAIIFEEPLNGLHGYHIYLGSYSSRDKALERVQEIIDLTGHQTVYATKTCQWEAIDDIHRPDRTRFITPSDKNKINDDLASKYHSNLKKELEREEKRKKIVHEIEEQQENENNPDTIEHYARNWFLAISNYAKLQFHDDKLKHFKSMFVKRKEQILDQYKKQPQFEDIWLDIYKDRLTERGEENVYHSLKNGHDELYNEIFKK